MDLELLRTFLEVNRTRHFAQAADALNVTPAAVSARIRLLESQLGVMLFERARRDTRPTPEGNRLLRHAELMLSEWRKARQDVSAGGADRQLSVGSSVRLWDVVLRDWLIRLRKEDPELALITHSQTPELLLRHLLDGVLDLAIMLDPPQLEELQTMEVATIKLVLVADKPGQPPEAAIGKDFLLVDWGLAHALELRRAFPDMPEPHTRLSSAGMAMAYLRELGGAAYLPFVMVRSALRRGRLHRVPGAPVFERGAFVLYPVRSERKELIQQVLQLFPQVAKAHRGAKQ